MTVSSTLNKIIYPGNASTTAFPFSFSVPGNILPGNPADIQVFFTDVNGNVTLLTNGPATSQYQLAINPVTGTNPTPIGGTVTYNPLGTPIPVGTSITIFRNLPLIQSSSFANQNTLYPPTIESAFDYAMMTLQQVLEIQNRALVVSVSDPTPNPIPAVTARAGLVLGFDSSGNPIAVSTAPAGVISSVMAPVVGAASLAAARTALGLGTIVTESIGLGLEDNGAGSLQTFYPEVSDAISQTVTSLFHANIRAATGSITYTFPLSSTLFNGFGFFIYARTAPITLAVNAADSFDGATTGASLTIPPGARAFVSTNAAGTWFINGVNTNGFNAPINLQINAAVASGAMTIALKDMNGNDPSPSSPIIYVVSAGGNTVPRAVTTPLSITVPSGATLATISGQPNRIWVGLFDNGGTPILGVYNSLNSASAAIVCWDETTATTTTAISAGSASAQTWYTTGALTSRVFRTIGYVESTQATAGNWSSTPGKVQLFGPGVKKPGDMVKCQQNTGSTSVVFSLINSCDVVKIEAGMGVQFPGGASSNTFAPALFRGATQITGSGFNFNNSGVSYTSFGSLGSLSVYDVPGASSATYSINFGSGNSGSMTINGGNMSFTEFFI